MPHPSPPDDSNTAAYSEDEGLQVLLVEDNPGDARLFEEYLMEGPVEVSLRYKETLKACLRALKEKEPDVLVADLGLPDSKQDETVEALVAAAPKVPIVVLTGRDDLQSALKAQQAGATEYLQKEELTPALAGRTLQWAVQRSRMQAKLRQRDAWIRSITEGLSAGVFRAGPTGRIEYANEALAEMLGFGQTEQLIGQDVTEFYVDPLQKGRMLAEEGASEVEVKFERQDGSTFVGLLTAKVAYDESGEVLHYDGTVTDVTERVQRKDRLRMLSKAVEQAKESVLITEAEPLGEPGPRLEYVNSAYEEMTGYSKEEMLGETPRILQGPETDREVLDSLREALEAGREWQGETVNYRKDGEPYRVQWNVAPVRGEDGDIEHWVSVQRDVTEKREREERLRLLAQGLQQVGDKVAITDRQGRIEYVNEAFEEMTGYTKQEALGRTPKILQSGEQTEDLYEELWETIQSGGTFRAELTNERKNGTRYVEDEVITPVTGAGGQVTHFVSTGRDVTERKRRKRELERQNDLFERAQEIANVGAWEYDVQTGEFTLTDQGYRVHGLAPSEDMTPGRSHELFHPEDRPKANEAFRRAVEDGEPYDIEARLATEGGEERWVRTRGEPQREGVGVARVRGAIQDITDRKKRERELVDAKEEAERMNRLKSAFLANMSHEIRTPLTSILGFSEAIADEVNGAREASELDLATLEEFSSLIQRSGHRLMDTLTGVLNLSKLQAGEMNLGLGPVDLAAEVNEAAEEFRPQAKEAGVEVTVQTNEAWALADEGGLQIAFRNLLSNAIKYTEEGGEVRVRTWQGEHMAALEVEDTGIGMDPETVSSLFEAFKQASEGVGREYEGTGLGLTVTKEVLGQMGGSVEVETEKGEGSRFTVRLPRSEHSGQA